MSGWQSIETAPSDGQDILVCVTHNLDDETWQSIMWVDSQSDHYVWPIYQSRIDIPFPPTHWTPLPEPPILINEVAQATHAAQVEDEGSREEQ